MTGPPVGILAGGGPLPSLAAEKLKVEDRSVLLYSLVPDRGDELRSVVDEYSEIDPAHFGSVPGRLKEDGVEEVLLIGDVDKKQIFNRDVEAEADEEVQEKLEAMDSKGDDSIIRAASRMLRLRGLRVIGIDEVLGERLTEPGHLAGPEPSDEDLATTGVLSSLAIKLADAEVGQAVTGKDQTVVAVEGVEGTSNLIERSGRLAGDNYVLLKLARSNQDYRYDVPAVGLETVNLLAETGASLLAVEAGVTLFLQQEECFRVAEQSDLSILGWRRPRNSWWQRFQKWLTG